jgi:hypothetical protein
MTEDSSTPAPKRKFVIVGEEGESKLEIKDKEDKKGKFIHQKAVFSEYKLSDFDNIPFAEAKWGKRQVSLCRKVFRIENENVHLYPAIQRMVMEVQANFQVLVAGVWCNSYEGDERCPMHRDSYNSTVITASIGGKRIFVTEDNEGKKTEHPLCHGDLVLFDEVWNANNKHSVAKMRKKDGENTKRISIVFFCV